MKQEVTPVEWLKQQLKVLSKESELYQGYVDSLVIQALNMEQRYQSELHHLELKLERKEEEIRKLKKLKKSEMHEGKKYVFENIISHYNGNADNLIKECELIAKWLIKK